MNMDKDKKEGHGQGTMDAFSLSDFFLHKGKHEWRNNLARFMDILFSKYIVAPTLSELCMNVAFQTSAKSSHPKRQVGAVALSVLNEIVCVGFNERPDFGGLKDYSHNYFESIESRIQHSFKSEKEKEIIGDIVEIINPYLTKSNTNKKNISKITKELGESKLKDLIEFMEEVHAEQALISAAARQGVSLKNSELFVTTFPCHLCAKLIVSTGIRKVSFVEPYPKSLAVDLIDKNILMLNSPDVPNKTMFEQYEGIGWSLYSVLFRKNQSSFDIPYDQISLESCLLKLSIFLNKYEKKIVSRGSK